MEGRSRRRVGGRIAALVVVAALGAACGGSGRHPVAHVSAAGAQAAVPDDLGTAFEMLLGHHATLAARLVRTGIRADDDLVEATDQALVANTADLGAVVEDLFGASAGQQFEELWATHLAALYDYATAVAGDEPAQREEALAQLEAYQSSVATFLAGATGGRVPEADLAGAFQAHLRHLTGEADAYGAGDFPRAYALQREAFAHMFPLGRSLGAAAAAQAGRPPVPVGTPDQQLRSTLGQVLGEHFELAVDAMRAATGDAAEFTAASDALAANAGELTQALDALFGAERAAAFGNAWADHVDRLVEYTTGVVEDDDAAKAAALDGMRAVRSTLARTFHEVTGGRIPVADLEAAFSMHDDELIRQIDAYAARDFGTAYEISYEGYRHMFELADTLASAIQAQLAAQAPVGAAQTGGGGAAPRDD